MEFETLDVIELDYIMRALVACGHNRTRAAKLLGISRATLVYKLKHAPQPDQGPTPESIEKLDVIEREYIMRVLVACNHNRRHAAKILGIARGTLITRLHQYGFHFVQGWQAGERKSA